jgi:hypothetical protein
VQQMLQNPQKACKKKNQFFLRNLAKQLDQQWVASVGKGNLIGEEDVARSQIYSTTVTCLSQQAKLFFVSREDFLKLQGQQATWSALTKIIESKLGKAEAALQQTTQARQRLAQQLQLGVEPSAQKTLLKSKNAREKPVRADSAKPQTDPKSFNSTAAAFDFTSGFRLT